MKLKDFLKEFVDRNGMFRVIVGQETVLDWDVVDMVHELENGHSRFQPLEDSEVERLECILAGIWVKVISVKVKASPELVRYVREDYVRKERDISNFCEGNGKE